MDTKSLVNQHNLITDALLAMTPTQREIVHRSIQTTQVEITASELFQPIFDNLSQCPQCHSSHFNKWGRAAETQRYYCKNSLNSFNSKTKTRLAKLHKCHIWEEYVRCMELKLILREANPFAILTLKRHSYGDIVFLLISQVNMQIRYLTLLRLMNFSCILENKID